MSDLHFRLTSHNLIKIVLGLVYIQGVSLNLALFQPQCVTVSESDRYCCLCSMCRTLVKLRYINFPKTTGSWYRVLARHLPAPCDQSSDARALSQCASFYQIVSRSNKSIIVTWYSSNYLSTWKCLIIGNVWLVSLSVETFYLFTFKFFHPLIR